MRAYIDVVDEQERDLIAQALCDLETRALVKTLGALLPLNDASRAYVINKAADKLKIDLLGDS